ncbi:MAG: type II secretion system F family protein, partial [Verrucomicrobiota bacterium]
LEEQEENPTLREVIGKLAESIEGGSTFSEAVAQHPRVFNHLYESMVRAGELGGVLEVVLQRLAEYLEKAQRIKGKVIAAMFYPVTVLVVAVVIMGLLMTLVVPKFQEVFKDLMGARPMPAFTVFVLEVSNFVKDHLLATFIIGAVLVVLFKLFARTRFGRRCVDRGKLRLPALGPVVRKVAIARFSRTLGTLMSSGVPILQALNIVRETAGNVIVAEAISATHASVKEGETIAVPLKTSRVFPAMVVGMVDVGEQTGALPEMLMKVADVYEEEVDNAVSAMTSLLEPIMIVFLAVVVGSMVIALFLPIIEIVGGGDLDQGRQGDL